MKLVVVRHGQTIENVKGIVQGQSHGTLTEKGHAQAEELADKLKGRHFDAIYSSDLNRCRDTARYIQKFHKNTAITYTEGLREYSFGEFHGKHSSEIDWESIPGDAYNRKPGGGESLLEGRERVLKFLSDVYKKYPKGDVLFVTHGGPIRIIRQYVDNRPLDELKNFEMENCAIFEFDIETSVDSKLKTGVK